MISATSDPEETVAWEKTRPRSISPSQWSAFEGYATKIFTAFGIDLGTPGTRDTPTRFLKALFDATSGYEGDPKLLTAFPTECHGGPDCHISQIIEGPISFFALCEHHALPFHGIAHVRGAYENDPELRREFLGACTRPVMYGLLVLTMSTFRITFVVVTARFSLPSQAAAVRH